ncbi:putative serine carboxypeptidase [Aspergillus stella-maris]|uniref:putative serine carboxypeptidase n=1 Tax=Aspergillus stella-maris TaxID=1810926 RepID=UPI003CCD2B6F
MQLSKYLALAAASFSFLGPAYGAPDVSQFKVGPLPGGPPLPPSRAGRLPVAHTDPGISLFFWLFEVEDTIYDDNLIIWFNGGPGCSSLIGLTTGNGPISFDGDTTRMVANPYSWTKFGHVLYVDQPVGTGYATASEPYPAVDNGVVTTHFYDWLQSFFAHFPHLQSKQLHLFGESWAGVYIPYFASAIVDNQDSFPLNLQSMTIGDGSMGNAPAISARIQRYLASHQSVLQILDDILDVFTEASKTCGFDEVLEEAAQFPRRQALIVPGNPEGGFSNIYDQTCSPNTTTPEVYAAIHSSCYGSCATFSTASNYLAPSIIELVMKYFGQADVQAALKVLPSASNSSGSTSAGANPPTAPPPWLRSTQGSVDTILPDLVTSHNISLHVYFGEYDFLLNHFSAVLTLQNMTWNGAQGFSSPITRSFYSDNAAPKIPPNPDGDNNNNQTSSHIPESSVSTDEAGKWASERGVTYHFFRSAGHSVFLSKPREMFAYVRDVVVAKSPLLNTNTN